MKKFAINSLTVNKAFDLEEVRLRCCLIILINSIILTIKMRCVYFDFKKAFDSVSHNRLIFKLEKFGFDKKFVHLINSYLTDRKQHVRISNVLHSPRSVPTSGVPQGSILGPILFSIFISDMPELVLSSICYLFADDLKRFSISSSINFQNFIDNVYQWSVKSGLIFHQDKTKFICNMPHEYFLISLVIERVPSIKDLGLFVTPNLTRIEHVNIKSGKALRCFFSLKRNIPYYTPMITKLQLYTSCVRSTLLLNSSILQPNIASFRMLEHVQLKRIKWICGLNEHKISIASIKLLPICYKLIYSDLVLFCNILQNNYDIKVEDYVIFYFPRAGSRAAHRTLFDFPNFCKTSTWGTYFIRTTANANIVSAKYGIDLRQEKPAREKRKFLELFSNLSISDFNPENSCTFFINCRCSTCRS